MKNVANMCLLLFFWTLIAGCNNDSGVNSKPPEPNDGPNFSLIPHPFVDEIYDSYTETGASAVNLDSTTGTVITVTSDILDFAAIACPALAPVAVLSDILSDTFADSDVNKELGEITSEIAALQQAVTEIETQLNFLNSAFYTYVSNSANQAANTAYNNFNNNDINWITSSSTGLYPLFIDNMGIVAGDDIDFTAVFQNIETTNTNVLNPRIENFTNIINNITNSQLSASADGSDLYEQITLYDYPDYIVNSDLKEYLIQMKYVIYAGLPEFPIEGSGTEGANAATLFKECNDQITYIFQLTLGALQSAYTVSAAINMINYQYSLTTKDPSALTYLSKLETNANLYFPKDKDYSLAAYQSAQKELAHVYVTRVNYLFDLALSYLVSDQPLADYSWPSMTTSDSQLNAYYDGDSYERYYEAVMSTAALDESSTYSTGTQDFPKISTNNGKGYVFYMYDGLNEFATCQANFLNGDGLTCPTLYSNYAPAQANTTDDTYRNYDGVKLKAWVYATDTDEAVNTYETNLSNRCNASSMTSRWDVTGYVTSKGTKAGFSCDSNMSYDTSSFDNPVYDLIVAAGANLTFQTYNNDNFFGAYFRFVNSSTGGFTYNSDKEIDLSTHSGHMWAIGLETSTGYRTTVGWHYEQADYDQISIACQLYDPLCYYIDNTDGATGFEGLCLGGRFVYIGENQDPSYYNTYYVHDDTGAGSTCENIYYD